MALNLVLAVSITLFFLYNSRFRGGLHHLHLFFLLLVASFENLVLLFHLTLWLLPFRDGLLRLSLVLTFLHRG